MLLGSLLEFHGAPEYCMPLILLACSQFMIITQEDPLLFLPPCVVKQALALFIMVPSDLSRIIRPHHLRVHAGKCVLLEWIWLPGYFPNDQHVSLSLL